MSTFTFNFQARFAADVEQGLKRQTIRKNRKDNKRPKPGDTVKAYTGLRTSHVRLLRQAQVVRCRSVRIHFNHPAQLVIDGDMLAPEARSEFAKADGFASWPDMAVWFKEHYGANGSGCFDGFCTEWE